MKPKKSLIGNTYGRLTVISLSKVKSSENKYKYDCVCTCGNIKSYLASNLKSGDSKSCGCLLKEIKQYRFDNNIDITNQRFGRLIVIKKDFIGKNKYWVCQCDCGNIKKVLESPLRQGKTRSCGCLVKENIEITRQLLKKHLHTLNRNKTSEYATWCNMKQRCLNKQSKYYSYYGGKGVIICERWLNSFENFLEDMGTKPSNKYSLDRIDSNGNYCKENCRWATKYEQNINRSHVIFYSHEGITLCKKDWAKKLNVSYYVFQKTLKKLNNFEDTYNYLTNT